MRKKVFGISSEWNLLTKIWKTEKNPDIPKNSGNLQDFFSRTIVNCWTTSRIFAKKQSGRSVVAIQNYFVTETCHGLCWHNAGNTNHPFPENGKWSKSRTVCSFDVQHSMLGSRKEGELLTWIGKIKKIMFGLYLL